MVWSGAIWGGGGGGGGGGAPKYVITSLKINKFRENPQKNLIAIFLSQINLD